MIDRPISNGFRDVGFTNAPVERETYRLRSKLRKLVTASIGTLMVITGVAQGLNYSSQYHGSLTHAHSVADAVRIIGNQDLHRTSHGMKLDIIDVGKFSTEDMDKYYNTPDSKIVYNKHEPEEFMLLSRDGGSINVHVSQRVLESDDAYEKTCSLIEEATRYGIKHDLAVKIPQNVAKVAGIRYVLLNGKAYPMTPEQLSHSGTMMDSYSLEEARKQGYTVGLPDSDSLNDNANFTARPDTGPKEYKNDAPDLEGHEPLMQSVVQATALGTLEKTFNH